MASKYALDNENKLDDKPQNLLQMEIVLRI